MKPAPFQLEAPTPTDLARETRAKADRAEHGPRLPRSRPDSPRTGANHMHRVNPEDIQAIYGDGWTAYADGLTIYDNPHDAGTQPARAWADGFAEAAADNA